MSHVSPARPDPLAWWRARMQELADQRGEPVLLITQPDPKREAGDVLTYAVLLSEAGKYERERYAERYEPRSKQP
jgi:hypothetical protein